MFLYMKNIIQSSRAILLAVLLSLGISYAYASWAPPTQIPPAGNITAPLNTSSTAQSKAGNLTISSDLIAPVLKDLNDPINFFLNPNADSAVSDIYLKPNASSTQTGSLYAVGDICINSTGMGSGICLNSFGGSGAGNPGNTTIFSTGADGDVELSSNTTLTRDYHYNNLTIDSGVTLNASGHRILVADTLINNGTITTSPGATGTLSGGSAGGAGRWSGNTCSYCQPCQVSNPTPCTNGASVVALGGTGGNAVYGCVGGTASSENLQVVKQTIPFLQNLSPGSEVQVTSVSNLYYIVGSGSISGINLSGGTGGGGGSNTDGCDNHYGYSGGTGGQGGGAILVAAKTLTNNGTITAPGGSGGNTSGYYYYDGAGNNSGGAGGGGGTILLIYKTLTNLGTVTAPGGPGGWSCGGYYGRTTPCSQDGNPGSAGNIYRAKIL